MQKYLDSFGVHSLSIIKFLEFSGLLNEFCVSFKCTVSTDSYCKFEGTSYMTY